MQLVRLAAQKALSAPMLGAKFYRVASVCIAKYALHFCSTAKHSRQQMKLTSASAQGLVLPHYVHQGGGAGIEEPKSLDIDHLRPR